MSADNASKIGMMEGAYFVGRADLLKWVNTLLGRDLKNVEEVASGFVYCELMAAIYPGTVPLAKVNFAAKHQHEFLANWKVFQKALAAQKIEKVVPVDELIKAKYMGNLEFLQWFKAFFDRNFVPGDYDPITTREKAIQAYKNSGPAHRRMMKTPSAAGVTPEKENVRKPTQTGPGPAKTASTTSVRSAGSKAAKPAVKAAKPAVKAAKPAVKAAKAADNSAAMKELMTKLAAQKAEVAELKLAADEMEKQRDFYYGKLREVEMVAQEQEDRPSATAADLLGLITTVLYKTDDNDEFVSPVEA